MHRTGVRGGNAFHFRETNFPLSSLMMFGSLGEFSSRSGRGCFAAYLYQPVSQYFSLALLIDVHADISASLNFDTSPRPPV
jgi:hypothetical protein